MVEHPRFRPQTKNLGLEYYYENEAGYSGTSSWLARSLSIPKSWKNKSAEASEHSSWRQPLLLGLDQQQSFDGGNSQPCSLGEPYRHRGAWLAALKDNPYQVNLDHLTAIKTLTHSGGSYRLQAALGSRPALLTYHDLDGSLLGSLLLKPQAEL